MKIGAIDKLRLARTGDEYLALVGSDADWIARSGDDVRQLRVANFEGWARLQEDDYRAFLNSLVFKHGGLAHGNYKPLMKDLTLTEIFGIFECFGMSRDYFARIPEYYCDSAGECKFSFWEFCASTCHPQPLPPK